MSDFADITYSESKSQPKPEVAPSGEYQAKIITAEKYQARSGNWTLRIIFQIDGGNYYETREYIDNRNIYAQNQNVFFDPMATYHRNVQETVDEVIRAEENLRRIRGY